MLSGVFDLQKHDQLGFKTKQIIEVFRNSKLALLKYGNELEIALDKSKFLFKFIWLAAISNLFPFEVTPKCQ